MIAVEEVVALTSIKRGRPSGHASNKHSMKTRSAKVQPLNINQVSPSNTALKQACYIEEAVDKVMEIGVVLGFDFNGKEKELADVIVRREEEDVVWFNEVNVP
ncbi:hypothetical protein Dsin_003283 [Dipteronia sinensis]|uniref:Uncharacterized protein n=1 Tax=Dipteronia sinensis TaxID=43782 RepID=A0AAE0B8U1_9ROSI|nr:hypothetical protein Dsin_003283 [Dipteronia sinensis]